MTVAFIVAIHLIQTTKKTKAEMKDLLIIHPLQLMHNIERLKRNTALEFLVVLVVVRLRDVR